MLKTTQPPVASKTLLEHFNPQSDGNAQLLHFHGFDGYDIYNPTTPFTVDGKTVMACRVEKRDTEDSLTAFFEEGADGSWSLIEDAPRFPLQDPCITHVGDELVLGGVRVIAHGKWLMDFYRGKTLDTLQKFTSGPMEMKDIRMVGLPDGRIGICSRPLAGALREKYGCLAKIGFDIAGSLDDIDADFIANAPLYFDHFLPEEWGGCNQLHVLGNGLLGAIGHISHRVGEKMLHYNAMAFAICPETRKMSRCKIIATRACFPGSEHKWPRVENVLFPAGILRNGDGTAQLYSGLSDCAIGRRTITDPFLEYEAL